VPLAPGDVFAGYQVVRTLGSGGMGAVYLVRHPRLPRLDALKLLRPELSADPAFATRFEREADVVAGLSHPNIVSVLDRGTEAGQLWLTMQYVDGHDAEDELSAAGGLLPADRVAHILTGVAAALDYAHREHLVHRDVKPANILLQPGVEDEPERVFLTDFGIAKSLEAHTKLTMTGAVVATFDYASPEQIESQPLDARSDVYSLGCVLLKLLTGTVPYPGHSVGAAIHGHLALSPPRPTERIPWLAPAVDDVVARAMAKDRANRYPTCRALAAATAIAISDFPPAPPLPYTFAVTRDGEVGSHSAGLSRTTERLPREETDRLMDLVRHTRFFDLPDTLPAHGGSTAQALAGAEEGQVTIEIASRQRTQRVTADLGQAHRPPQLDALVAVLERLLDRAPSSFTSRRRAAPTTVPTAGSDDRAPGLPPTAHHSSIDVGQRCAPDPDSDDRHIGQDHHREASEDARDAADSDRPLTQTDGTAERTEGRRRRSKSRVLGIGVAVVLTIATLLITLFITLTKEQVTPPSDSSDRSDGSTETSTPGALPPQDQLFSYLPVDARQACSIAQNYDLSWTDQGGATRTSLAEAGCGAYGVDLWESPDVAKGYVKSALGRDMPGNCISETFIPAPQARYFQTRSRDDGTVATISCGQYPTGRYFFAWSVDGSPIGVQVGAIDWSHARSAGVSLLQQIPV
jgi:serine/threonine protein kinase